MNTIEKDQEKEMSTVKLNQAKDTGMAMVLICLIVWMCTKNNIAIVCATVILLLDMTIPRVFIPVARIWFGLSMLMGKIISKILLTVIFVILVIPVGLVRKCIKKDTLRLKEFKKNSKSFYIERDHLFDSKDLLKPF